jgi:hypothetical protein
MVIVCQPDERPQVGLRLFKDAFKDGGPMADLEHRHTYTR